MLDAPFFPFARHSCHLACTPFRHITKVQGHLPAFPATRAFKKQRLFPEKTPCGGLALTMVSREEEKKKKTSGVEVPA